MIKLRDLLNEEFTAVSNKSGKTVVFKNKDSRDAAVKAGTHEVPEDEKGGKDKPKGDKPNMFSKDAGYDTPDTDKSKKSKPKLDNAYDAKDFESHIESLKGKIDDSEYEDIKGEMEALKYMQMDMQDLDDAGEDTYNEKIEIDSAVEELKDRINAAMASSKKSEPFNADKDAGYDSPDAKSDNKLSLSKRGPGFDMTAASKLEDELGGGISDLTDDGVITFSFGENDKETSLYFGKEDDQFAVSVETPYGDDFGDMEYFDNEADAIAHAKELVNKYSKELGGSSNTNKYDKDSDENEFENALKSDGFSWFGGGSLEGTSTFGDESGNTVSVASGDVYDSESAFVVSGYNEDDPVNVESEEFDSKEEALAYAKKLAQKLKSSNEGTIKLMNLLRK